MDRLGLYETSERNVHVIYDVTLPEKIKIMTPKYQRTTAYGKLHAAGLMVT